jgi:hypothetical protein
LDIWFRICRANERLITSSNNQPLADRQFVISKKITVWGGSSLLEGICMLTPALVSLLLGLVLAQRFKVLSLLPVIMLTGLFAFPAVLSDVRPVWTTALTFAIAIAALQLGYLLGLAVRHLMLVTRALRLRAASRLLPSQ